MKKCGYNGCQRRVKNGETHCEKCREQALKEHRARNREHVKHYMKSGTPKANAYVARRKLAAAAACKAWCRRHTAERDRSRAVVKAIADGKLKKPKVCQGTCKRKVSPLVAVGVKVAKKNVTVAGFVCWSCFWAIRRGEQPLP